SDFGYHILLLTGIKQSAVKDLEEIKGSIAEELKKQQSAKKYSETVEIFTNLVYEQADSLQPVADKLKLKIETIANVTRQPNPAVAPTAPFNDAKFLKALFSDDALKNKRNTEAVEVAKSTLIAGRVVEYKAASKKPFEEVQALIRERVTQIEAAKLANKAGEAKLATLKAAVATADANGFSEVKIISRSKNAGLNGSAVNELMKIDTSKLPAYLGLDLPGQGYAIYKVIKINSPAKLDATHLQAEQQKTTNALAQQELAAYVEVLKKKAKVRIMKHTSSATTANDAVD
ncbi:MAG: peptidylprolyl isomerase, partial [Pseudomonadota bacterium]